MDKVSVLDISQFHPGSSPDDFYSNTIANHLQTRHKDIALPHKHNFYLAMLFTSGTGIHEVDFTSYDVKPGSLFFLNPGQTHHWELSKDADGYIFFHTQQFYDLHYTHNRINHFPFFYSIHNLPCLYPEKDTLHKLTMLFKMAFDEKTGSSLFKEHKMVSLIDLIYIESSRSYLQHNPGDVGHHNPYSVKFAQLEQLVEKHFKTEKSPAAYAGMLNMSAKHLNRITQSATGKTTSDIITERVLLEAKRELILQQHTFSEIALSLGYDEYAYFSRLFKKKTGETPSGFLARYKTV